MPDVVDAVGGKRKPIRTLAHLGRVAHHARDALDDVGNVGEVATAMAVVVDLDGAAAAQDVRELEVRHVGPTHGTVHGEEPQARGRNRIELGVRGGHELVGLLRGGIERDRRVHAIVLGEGNLLVATVHGRGARVHEVPHRVMTAALEDVEEADEVALEVGAGVLDGVADTRLSGEVHDDVEALLGEQTLEQGGVGEVAANEFEATVNICLAEHRQASFLDARIIVVVEVVETDDSVVGGIEQPLHEERADEAGSAGDEDIAASATVRIALS